jgi:hypothetical protein
VPPGTAPSVLIPAEMSAVIVPAYAAMPAATAVPAFATMPAPTPSMATFAAATMSNLAPMVLGFIGLASAEGAPG